MRRLLGWTMAVALGAALGCGDAEPPAETAAGLDPRAGAPETGLPVAEIVVRDHGAIRIELFPHIAPDTVAHWLKLAVEGFYDGTTFHRVIPGFMIQGGDPLSRDPDPRNDGQGDPGYTIGDEFSALAHIRGRVSMANRGSPDSGGSQFFITVADRRELDRHYTLFGEVVAGMEVVDAIAAVETDLYGRHGPLNRPLEDVVVESVRVVGDAP